MITTLLPCRVAIGIFVNEKGSGISCGICRVRFGGHSQTYQFVSSSYIYRQPHLHIMSGMIRAGVYLVDPAICGASYYDADGLHQCDQQEYDPVLTYIV